MFRYEVSIRLEKAKQFKDVFVSEFSHKLTEQEQQGYLRFLNKNNQGFFCRKHCSCYRNNAYFQCFVGSQKTQNKVQKGIHQKTCFRTCSIVKKKREDNTSLFLTKKIFQILYE